MISYDWERSISFLLSGFQTLCSAKLADIELSLNGKCFFFVLFCFYFLIETTLSLKQISEFEMNLTLLFIIF